MEYRDYYATATTTIPPTTVRPDFFVEKCADSDTLYQVKVSFSDPPGEKNYYQLFARTGADSKQYFASYLGSIDDAVLADHTEYTVYRGRKLGAGTDYTPYFAEQDTVAVKLAQVDKASYQFWDGFTKNLSPGGQPVPGSLHQRPHERHRGHRLLVWHELVDGLLHHPPPRTPPVAARGAVSHARNRRQQPYLCPPGSTPVPAGGQSCASKGVHLCPHRTQR